MSELFSTILTMSLSASYLVLAVLVIRLALKKAPKWISVLLWGLVAVRLLMPFSIESSFSLLPEQLVDGEFISSMAEAPSEETVKTEIYLGDVHGGQELLGSTVLDANLVGNEGYSVHGIVSVIWLTGVVAMLLYTVISYVLLKRKVSTATLFRKRIFMSEHVASPFVLGFFMPKIYLPYWIDDRSMAHVIAHEEAHIRRKDHWWKPLGFLLLAIHWFNPLMWIGYILLCRDIELACDEKVIKEMDSDTKADYTQALVDCSVNRHRIAACPLAFGEVGVKERVKSVMNYKKPGFWILLASTLVCIVVAVCFLTDPKEQPHPVIVLSSQNYAVEEVTFENGIYSFVVIPGENSPVYSITNDMYLSSQGEYGAEGTWTSLGKLEKTKLTSTNFDELFKFSFWTGDANALKIRQDTQQAWKLIYDEEFLYYLLQQKNGDLYLAYGYTSKSFGEASIRWLFKLAAQSNDLGPVETIHGNLKTYYKNADGTYQFNGLIYQTRMEIRGQMPNSSANSTFVYLSNLKNISFDRAWKAAGLSSNMSDYFDPEEAVLVDWNTVSAEEEYEKIQQDYISLKNSISTMTEPEGYSAYADLFNRIADGSPSQKAQYAQLVRQIISSNVTFEDEEVFDIAKDYAAAYSRIAEGDKDWGVQGIELKKTSSKTARLDFPYWGEMWYSVKMVQLGEDWVTGEFTDPYQGEIGQYLMTIQFNEQDPSINFLKQYPAQTDHKLRISRLGADRKFTMRIQWNASHGYNVYIGSDEPFIVAEQSPVRLNRLFGTVSVNLNFDPENVTISTEETTSETEPTTEPVTTPTTEPVIDDPLVDPPLDVLDVAISQAILKQHRSDDLEGPINAESHIILGRASISGTPVIGELGAIQEEIVLVYYVDQRFCLSGEYLEEGTGTSGEAVITFSVNEKGEYVLKDFIKAEDYDPSILKNFVSDLEPIREKENDYAEYLRISCWNTASSYLNDLRAVVDMDLSNDDPKLFLDKRVLDWDADGCADLLFGLAVELLSPL